MALETTPKSGTTYEYVEDERHSVQFALTRTQTG